MIIILSKVFHFAAHHPFWLMIALVAAAGVLATFLGRRTGTLGGIALIPIAFVLGMTNVMTGHWMDAIFVNRVGVYGSAVIIDRRDANFMLNDRPVSYFDTLVKTADGREILTNITEMSAAIYPLRNAILIPPMNEHFVIKYVPGDEKNFVIMSDESDYGKQRLLREARQPVDHARRLYEASPANPDFVRQYREALKTFLSEQATNAPADQLEKYRTVLEGLAQKARM